MKQIVRIGLVASFVLIIGALFFDTTATVRADTRAPLSEAHKQRIVAKCTSVKSSLRQLHRSDASLRVNRGQLYEFVGTKLMTRLNSRLVTNRLDASMLVGTTVRYDKALAEFRTAYRFYEEQLSALLRIDCTRQPETFYYSVVDVRAKRAEVRKKVSDLSRIMGDYHKEFVRFSDEYSAAAKELGNE